LYLNLWGANGVPGTQCANLLSANNNAVSWKTTWVWANGSGKVKSFANVNTKVGLNKQLSNIMSILASVLKVPNCNGILINFADYVEMAYDI
jgi:xyloglucan-specific endo-beta-1,4-glucanase